MAGTARRVLAAVIAALASAAILITLLANYADGVIVNPSSFGDHATSVLHTGSVDALVVERVTAVLSPHLADASGVRPAIEDGVREAVASRSVTEQFRSAAEALDAGLLSGTAQQLTLSLPDVGSSIAPGLESESPLLASEIRNIGTVRILDVQIPPTAATVIHDAASVSDHSSQLLVVSAALILLALLISADRRRTLLGLGLRALASGLLLVVLYIVAREALVSEFSGQQARLAVRAVWSTYLNGLEMQGLVLTGAGALVAGAARVV